MTAHGRRCPSVGPTGHDPCPRTNHGLVDTPATHLPAARPPAHPLPAHGHCDTSRILRTFPRPPAGSTRSPTTNSGSHLPMPACIGTEPGPTTARGHEIPHDVPLTARDRKSIITGLGIATIANIRPGTHTLSPAGPVLRCPAPRCTIWTSPLAGTTGMRNSIGRMPHQRRTGTAATPKPRPRTGNTPTAPAVAPPWAGFPLCGIPRPSTHRQPMSLLQIGSHGTNLMASLTGGKLRAGQVRAGTPASPLNGTASSSSSGAEGSESPSSPPPEAHHQDPSATRARAHVPATSGRPTRYRPSSPREHEGDRTESLYSVEEERDDSFTAVFDLIRRFHNLEKPAGVASSRGKTALAQTLGLQAKPSPSLHLPSSPLVGTLVDDVNFVLAKFVEE